MKKRVFLIGLIFLLMIPVFLLGLLNSTTGSRWLLQQIFPRLPGQVSIENIEGRLLERITLSGLNFQTDSETVSLSNLVFSWQPSKLLSGTLKIHDLTVNDLHVTLTQTPPTTEKSSFDPNTDIQLPVEIVIENILLTNLKFQQGDQVQQLEKMHLSAFTDQGQLHLVSLEVNAKPMALSAKGQLGLGKGFPFSLTTDWQVTTEDYGLWGATTTVEGNIHQLTFDNQVSSPFNLAVNGSVDDLLGAPQLTIGGNWQKLRWPLTENAPQVSSEQGDFEMSGGLTDYRIKLKAELSQQYLPKAQLVFNGKGGKDAFAIEKLEIQSTTGTFELAGAISWQDGTVFDLTATGQEFNPSILMPELPGNLTFAASFKGKLAGETLEADANISKLSGTLRGNPVSAQGRLFLAGEQLKVDTLKIVSGANTIAVNGSLGKEQAALDIAIDTPALASLWPNLGGSLKGTGQLQGAWKNPTVKFNAKGKRLHFAEHSVEQLAIDIDYHADPKEKSTIQLAASAIKTGTTQIAKLLIDGLGTPERHSVNADISSSYGDLSSSFSGSFKADAWQGDFSKLDFDSKDFGQWQLKDQLNVRVAHPTAEREVTLAESCFVQQDAALCAQGRYSASGDFQFHSKASNLPTRLIQTYLPKQIAVHGIIDAEADVQQQKGLMTGNYRLAMPESTRVLVQTQKPTELVLGASLIKGKLKGKMVSADFDLGLIEQDYVKGQVQVDAGKAQSLSGQITSSVHNFQLVKAFAPQVSDMKGALKVDMEVQGSIAKPVAKGTIAFEQGAIEMADIGVGVRDINLQAIALGGPNNHIQLQGSALPTSMSTEDAPEQFQLKGIITVTADMEQRENLLAGQYRFEIPMKSSLLVKTKAASTEIPVGGSFLSGTIEGTKIAADFSLVLVAQDYLRAQLHLDTGETHALSGQVTSSIVEFGMLHHFVPQLSNIKGNLKTDVALSGSTDKPIINGAVNFTDGAIDLAESGFKIREIKLQALTSADHAERIQLSGSAKSGQGFLQLEGFADLHGVAELYFNGTDFEVSKVPEAQIAVSPELKLTFAERQGKVSGILKIPKAILQLKELPDNVVKVSSDEVIVGEEKIEQNKVVATNIDADIEVELGKQISFSGQGLKTNLSGKLKITKTGEKMVMHGKIDMNKARYKSYGQDLTVRKGRFLFNGPIDKPWLDVEAIRLSKSKEVTAILSLTGPVAAPKTRISSEPALPEAEALAYLVTGRPLNQVSKSEGNMVASAALSYGSGKMSWVADKLGVNEFEVSEGKTLQDTLVTVGQYLTPDFYVGTKVGLFNQQAVLVLKRKLSDTLNIETQTGVSQSVKFNYEFDAD